MMQFYNFHFLSYRIQNTSALKKRIERLNKNIINGLKENYEEAAAEEAKYQGEGTAEYYKSQHIMVPPARVMTAVPGGRAAYQSAITIHNGRVQTAKPGGRRSSARGSRPLSAAGSGRARRGSKRLIPTLQTSATGAAELTGLSSTNKILLNKGAKGSQLPPLSSQHNTQSGRALPPLASNQSEFDNMRLLQGPPAVSMCGFEGGYSLGQKNLELARSKFLVDKLTGKLPEDLRRGTNRARAGSARVGGPLPPRRPSQRSEISSKSIVKKPSPTEDAAEEETQQVAVAQQKWSDLDKYIELLLDSKSEEETVFVYLNPNPNSDPYDLLVVSYQDRKA